MKATTVYLMIAVGALAYWYKYKRPAVQGKDMGGGWRMNKEGTKAYGPNGEEALATGYMTGDPYPAAGQLSI